MARTRASVAAKVVTGKSSKARCSAAPTSRSSGPTSSSSDKPSKSYSGGNPVCPRETPKWQKPITNFFIQNQSAKPTGGDTEDPAKAGSSKSKPKRNIIHSDDEEEPTDEQTDKPVNKELDETIELEQLTGEDSHKIDEYYTTKDKGKGKKSRKDKIDKDKIHKDEIDKDKIDKDEIDKDKIDKDEIEKDKIDKDKINKDKIDKENINSNVIRNKRHLDELNEDDERDSKKVKVD